MPDKKDQKLHEMRAFKLGASFHSTTHSTMEFEQNAVAPCGSTRPRSDGANGGSERSLQDLSFATMPDEKDQKPHEMRAFKLGASFHTPYSLP